MGNDARNKPSDAYSLNCGEDKMKTETESKVEERIKSELSPVNVESRFADMLDECYSFESVGGPFAHMLPSRVLRECDDAICDFLCDLMHFAKITGQDFGAELARGRMHFEAETSGED